MSVIDADRTLPYGAFQAINWAVCMQLLGSDRPAAVGRVVSSLLRDTGLLTAQMAQVR